MMAAMADGDLVRALFLNFGVVIGAGVTTPGAATVAG